MIKINLICVGKLKESYWRAAQEEYVKRLSRFCKAEVREVPERFTLKEEAENILRLCRGHTIALAVEGTGGSSETFAEKLGALCDRGEEITFVIGSSCGRQAQRKGIDLVFGVDVSAPDDARHAVGTNLPCVHDFKRIGIS